MTNTFNRFSQGEEERYLSRLPPQDRELVEKFIRERSSLGKTLSRGRVKKILFSLATLRSLSPAGFGELSQDDVITILDRLKKKGWTANTTRDVIAVLKPFLKWMVVKTKAPALSLDWIDEIKIPPMESRQIRAEDLLTDQEIEKIIKAASPRDRAIISLMADAGLRPIEAGSLRFSDLEFKDNSLYVHVVSEKTPGRKKPRRIPAPRALYYVQAWIDQAPYPIGDDGPLFRSSRVSKEMDKENLGFIYPPLKDDALRWCIREAARRAGVKRYRHPYQFRHGAITRWIDAGISTAKVAKLSHGGPSRMVESVYWHGDDQAIGAELMARVHGRGPVEKAKAHPTTRVCPGCGRIYPLSVQFCTNCGPLTESAKNELKTDQEIARNQFQKVIAGMTATDTAQLLNEIISNLQRLSIKDRY